MCMHATHTQWHKIVNLLPSLPTAQHMRMHAIIFSNFFISPPLSSSGRRRRLWKRSKNPLWSRHINMLNYFFPLFNSRLYNCLIEKTVIVKWWIEGNGVDSANESWLCCCWSSHNSSRSNEALSNFFNASFAEKNRFFN